MIIVVEGVDGVGKSGLVHALAKRLFAQHRDWVYLTHYGPPPYNETFALSRSQQASDDLLRALDVLTGRSDEHLIIDRWSWGCPVYGPVFRPDHDVDGFGELGRERFFLLEDALDAVGGKTFWLDAPQNVISYRLSGRGDWYLSDDYMERMDQIQRLRENYAKLAHQCKTFAGGRAFQLLKPADTNELADRIVSGEFHD